MENLIKTNGKREAELEKEFPEHLGFGILDCRETRFEPGTDGEKPDWLGVYRDRSGDKVYEVSLGEDSCKLTEFYRGEMIRLTYSTSLKKAFFQNMNSHFHAKAHPRYADMIKRLNEGRDIHFDCFGGAAPNKKVFFPEGCIFLLRMPVYPASREEAIQREFAGLRSPIYFLGVDRGILLFANKYGDIIHSHRPLAHFGARLFELEEAVDLCFSSGLLRSQGQWGAPDLMLHVLVLTGTEPGQFQVFRGDGEQVPAYAHLLNREGDISLDQARAYVKDALGKLGFRPDVQKGSSEAGDEKQIDNNKETGGTTLMIKDQVFGHLMGVQMKKERTIFCWECYQESYGTIIYLGSMEPIYDEEEERIARRGTSGLYLGDQEVVICQICGRVMLRIPPRKEVDIGSWRTVPTA